MLLASRITGLKIKSHAFRPVPAKPDATQPARAGKPRGALAEFKLDGPAKVTFTIERGRDCVDGICRSYERVPDKVKLRQQAGKNFYALTGRLAGKRMAPGHYRLVAVPRNRFGQVGRTVRATFRLLP